MIELFLKVLDFAVPVLIMMFVGLVGTSVLVELGLMQKISKFVSPIFAYPNLPDTCASAFLISMGSTVAANSMLLQAKKDNCLEDKEVLLCAMMNATPAYFRELFTYQVPIVLPALGLVVGGFYSLVFVITAIVKILVIAIASKLLLKGSSCKTPKAQNNDKVSLKIAFIRALRKEFKIFLRIAGVYLIATTIIFFLQEKGAFKIFSVLPLAELFKIPSQSLVPLISYVASPTLGISLLGPMLHAGEITDLQAMIVLMLGSMFMLPIFALRSQVPQKIAIFGTRLGIKIVAYSTAISVLVRLLILLILLSITF
jgi:hypothetical protein